MIKSKEKIHVHSFKCLACKHKWNIESKIAEVNQVFPNFCPNCGTKKTDGKLEWDFTPPTHTRDTDLEKKRKANVEHTKMSIELAAKMERETPQEEMVTLERPKELPITMYGQEKYKVPKKTIDKLKEKGEKFAEENT